LFARLFKRCQQHTKGHRFKFKNPLYSLDASTIDWCLSVFPWVKFRTTKGAIKLHVGLNHTGYLPAFVSISDGKTADITLGRTIRFPQGSIVVMDRGYTDYQWYKQLTSNGIYFVSRLKSHASYKVIKRQLVPKSTNITSDQVIQLTGQTATKHCSIKLRRIGYRDTTTGKHYVFLTNHFKLSSNTIAAIYKDRWQIELFFKWIKQSLKIKSFIGTSKNAVMTQLWIALCVYLILAVIKL